MRVTPFLWKASGGLCVGSEPKIFHHRGEICNYYLRMNRGTGNGIDNLYIYIYACILYFYQWRKRGKEDLDDDDDEEEKVTHSQAKRFSNRGRRKSYTQEFFKRFMINTIYSNRDSI